MTGRVCGFIIHTKGHCPPDGAFFAPGGDWGLALGTLYALNAGKSDCFILRLEDGREVRTVIIDGGTRTDPRLPPQDFLSTLGAREIDLMIMTHLHQDHLGFLPEVAEAFPVARAVLPYPPVPLSADRMKAVLREKQLALLSDYNGLCDTLSRQGEVYTTYPVTTPDFAFGDYRIRCCYPAPGTPSPVWDSYREAAKTPDDEKAHEIITSTKGAVNGDSSVWLICKEEKPVALICGDCLDASLAQAVERHALDRVPILKLSHHGRNEKLVYYTPETVGGLRPDIILVSADEEVRDKYYAEWKTLSSQARLMVTCEAEGFFRLPL